MRRRVPRSLAFAMAVVSTAAILLAGCGSNGGTGNSTSGTSATTLPQAATAPTVNTSAQATAEKKPEDYTAELTMWGWDEPGATASIAAFNKVYPNIKITYVPVSDYLKKFQTAVATGSELPDIGWQERGAVGTLYQMDVWEDLSQAPYNFDTSTVFDYIVPHIKTPDGKVAGVPTSVAIGGMGYKRDLAKEYFGTDDPEQLQAMFQTWDDYVAKGKEVLDKSGGKVYMFAGPGEVSPITMGQNAQSLADDTTFNLTEATRPTFEVLAKMRDTGIIDKIDTWSAGWNASFSDKNHIFYQMPTWGPTFMLDPNDKSSGNWGLISPPGGAVESGGTSLGIVKSSKNKEAAWQYIKWNYLTTEGATFQKSLGNFTFLKSAYQDASFTEWKHPKFGDQDIGEKFYVEMAPAIKSRDISKYDGLLNDTMNIVIKVMVNDKGFSVDDAMAAATKEVTAKNIGLEIK